jgi:hypothetical protein
VGVAAGLRHFAILPEPLVGVKLIRDLRATHEHSWHGVGVHIRLRGIQESR